MNPIKQQPPQPQPCHSCSTPYAGICCPICKVERPAFTAMKAITAKQWGKVLT